MIRRQEAEKKLAVRQKAGGGQKVEDGEKTVC